MAGNFNIEVVPWASSVDRCSGCEGTTAVRLSISKNEGAQLHITVINLCAAHAIELRKKLWGCGL